MIHFSLTPEQAKQLIREIAQAKAYRLLMKMETLDHASTSELLMDRIASAVVAARPGEIESTRSKLEETPAIGGVELCPRIS